MADLDPDFRRPESERASAQGCVTRGIAEERRLLEYLDGVLSASENRLIEAHLTVCPGCRTLARQWQELDACLSARLAAPGLPSDFGAQVWRKIESASNSVLGAASPKLEPLDDAWAKAWARHRRRFLWTQLPNALDNIGYALAAGAGMYLIYRLLIGLSSAWTQTSQALPQQWILPFGLGISVLVLLVVIGFSAKRPVARLLAIL